MRRRLRQEPGAEERGVVDAGAVAGRVAEADAVGVLMAVQVAGHEPAGSGRRQRASPGLRRRPGRRWRNSWRPRSGSRPAAGTPCSARGSRSPSPGFGPGDRVGCAAARPLPADTFAAPNAAVPSGLRSQTQQRVGQPGTPARRRRPDRRTRRRPAARAPGPWGSGPGGTRSSGPQVQRRALDALDHGQPQQSRTPQQRAPEGGCSARRRGRCRRNRRRPGCPRPAERCAGIRRRRLSHRRRPPRAAGRPHRRLRFGRSCRASRTRSVASVVASWRTPADRRLAAADGVQEGLHLVGVALAAAADAAAAAARPQAHRLEVVEDAAAAGAQHLAAVPSASTWRLRRSSRCCRPSRRRSAG